MAIHFIGDCEWRVVRDPQWTVDSWGVDHCVITFQGRRDKKRDFENSIAPFQILDTFSGMRLLGWQNSGGTVNMPCIDLEYTGFRSGRIPLEHGESGISVQSAQGSGTYEGTDPNTGDPIDVEVTGTFLYRASRTTWTWFETTRPTTTPRFATVAYPLDPLANIIGYSITDPQGKQISVSFKAFTKVFNSLIRQVVVSDYTIDPILPGALWRCSATADYKLQN